MSLSELFLIFSYLALIGVANVKQYKTMLLLNIASCWLCGVYLFMNEALVGASVTTIAGFANLVQFLLPEKRADTKKDFRNLVAICFSFVAVGLLYSRPSDIFPCCAFTLNRLSEAQGKPQVIRAGLIASGFLWSAYAWHNGLYLFVGIEMVTLLFIIHATIKSRQQTAKAV